MDAGGDRVVAARGPPDGHDLRNREVDRSISAGDAVFLEVVDMIADTDHEVALSRRETEASRPRAGADGFDGRGVGRVVLAQPTSNTGLVEVHAVRVHGA